ncbi:MAG: alpha/beta fold hydrolase [Gammaproteobacteria bacterium]|nr:alpha/beta fold hydrolase [Gammaproteobacteria bacterium]MBU1647320.1 alpha/beta fold hydrolase [Gammaproteobacteria bacterium]MBU1973112.1 alpha/beta fold hydrolase [Gammaproteobacteria bacterium]
MALPLAALAAAVAFAAALLLGLRHLLHRGLAPARIPEQRSPGALGAAFEEARIPTANDKHLFGWFVPALTEGRAPAVAILHGWGGNAETMLPLIQPLAAAGFAVLLFDARCHGRSDEDDFASLPRFAEDMEHALGWLRQRPEVDPGRVAIVGHSVGAGAALLVASRRDDIAAVVSLAAFSHPARMMRRWLAAKRIPHVPLGWAILAYVQRVIGHRFDAIAPVASIRGIRCPTLLIHGADDVTVPVSEMREIYAARSGDHVQCRVVAGSHDDFGDASDIAGEITEVVKFLRQNAVRSAAA